MASASKSLKSSLLTVSIACYSAVATASFDLLASAVVEPSTARGGQKRSGEVGLDERVRGERAVTRFMAHFLDVYGLLSCFPQAYNLF
jgi:hypothetical protein